MPILLYAIPIVLLFFLFSGGKKKASLDDFFKGGTKETDEASGGSKYGAPSITKTKADSIAEALFVEMGGFISSEKKILSMLKGLTQADYILVFDSFGLKNYDTMLNTNGSFYIGEDMNLTKWLTHEVDSKDGVAQLKKQFPDFF